MNRIDSLSLILDLDAHSRAAHGRVAIQHTEGHRHVTTTAAILDRVLDQIAEHLIELIRIAIDHDFIVRGAQVYLDPFVFGDRTQGFDDALQLGKDVQVDRPGGCALRSRRGSGTAGRAPDGSYGWLRFP